MTDVEKVKESLSIVDLIQEYVPLKQSGRNFKANCPFHSEKTPSFYVSAERQSWYCFGCSRGGDIISFYMEAEKVDFPEALRDLAQRAGIPLSQGYETSKDEKIKERIYGMNMLMREYFHYVLLNHSVAQKAREYLENRGVHKKIIETFSLGYSPNAWNAQTDFLKKKGYTEEEIEKAGLGIPGRRGVYDRFRGRLMFPIRDHRGQTIAFAGRVLDPEAKEAKYINSPETPVYTKGNTLYGIDVTRDAIKKEKEAIVVEGEFDLLSAFSAGTTNVVAIKGTALTPMQIRLLKRFTDTIVFALDADVAGDQAARRGIQLADEEDISMKAVILPSGKDPDECIRENPLQWKKAVEKAVPIYDFILSSTLSKHDPKTVDGKKRISDDLIPVIESIKNAVIQGHYIRQLAELLNVSEETIVMAVKKSEKQPFIKPMVTEASDMPGKTVKRSERLEYVLVALAFQLEDKELVDLIMTTIEPTDITVPSLVSLFELLKKHYSGTQTLPLMEHIKNVPDELVASYNRMILYPIDEAFPEDERSSKVKRVVGEIKTGALRRKISECSTKIRTLPNDKHNEMEELNNQLQALTSRLKSIQNNNFEV